MRIRTKNNGRVEGYIYELFTYLPNLDVFPNSSDMKKLAEMKGGNYEDNV